MPRRTSSEANVREPPVFGGGAIDRLFAEHGHRIELVVHAAAQPSHDWAALDPVTDFTVNANATLALLEASRRRNESERKQRAHGNLLEEQTPEMLSHVK